MSMKEKLEQIAKQAFPILPVMVIDNIEQALPMGKALRDGGITVFEITLRTECAIEAIALLKKELPDCIVGAGTVVNGEQFNKVVEAGGDFIVSPGITPELLQAAKDSGLPFIPGVNSPSDVMLALSYGFETQKFFPAQQSGGTAMLKALSGPFGQVRFCPTGGISVNNANEYLALPNVFCIGGSWVLPKDAVTSGDWDTVTELAKEAIKLAK